MAMGSGLSPEGRKKLFCVGILAVYSIITLFGALNHELWFDEAQAWCIARDATLSDFSEILKHEGHPALWYLILMPFAKAGAYCGIIGIISWLFSVVAAGLFLFRAPFGLVIKTSVVFSSGFLFFNSVNSRVYCLIPLILFLIAAVYPKRRKYAAIYGLLVGLLANTHIMMSGLVAVLGILMLIELFKGIKQEGIKKNTGGIIGFAVAGLLVIAMILPLLGSLSANSMVNDKDISAGTVILNSLSVFKNVGANLMIYPDNTLSVALGIIPGLMIVAAIAAMTAYKRGIIMCGVFTAVYALIIEGIWFTTQLRAPIFLYTYSAIFWIAVENEKPVKRAISTDKASAAGGQLIKAVNCLFVKPEKAISLVLCAVLLFSAPSGLYWLIYDSFNETVLTKNAAEFIREELPEDAVIIMDSQSGVQFNAYNPKIRLYSLELQSFITYTPHEIPPDKVDYDKIRKDLENEKNLYHLTYSPTELPDTANENALYDKCIDIPPYAYTGAVRIERVELSDILEL